MPLNVVFNPGSGRPVLASMKRDSVEGGFLDVVTTDGGVYAFNPGDCSVPLAGPPVYERRNAVFAYEGPADLNGAATTIKGESILLRGTPVGWATGNPRMVLQALRGTTDPEAQKPLRRAAAEVAAHVQALAPYATA